MRNSINTDSSQSWWTNICPASKERSGKILVVALFLLLAGCMPQPAEKLAHTNEELFLANVNKRKEHAIKKFNDTITLLHKDTFYFPSIHTVAFSVKIEDTEDKQSYYLLLLRDSIHLNDYCFLPCSFPNIKNTCYPNFFYTHNVGYYDFNQYLTERNVENIPISTIDSLYRIIHGCAHGIGAHFNKEDGGIPEIKKIEDIAQYKFELDSSRKINMELLEIKLKDPNFHLYYYGGGLESIELVSNFDYGLNVCDTINTFQKKKTMFKKEYMFFHLFW